MNLKKLGFLITATAIIGGTYTLWSNTSNEIEDQQQPGWFKHYMELKGDENGEIPQGMTLQWYRADKESRVLNKKTENDLTNITEIGPDNVGGRTRSIVIDHSNPTRLICAGVSGGIWVSENNGSSWQIVDDFGPTLSATSITQSPFDKDLFYYGTGEPMGNSADLGGLGLFRSTDGAKSFQHLEHTDTTPLIGIWDVEHSLTLDSTIYVATTAGGIWRSTDAGNSFSRIYTTGSRVHEIEVLADGHIMAAINGYGIVKINENDLSVTRLNGGDWPAGGYSRISFDYCKNYPSVMYAQVAGSNQSSIQGLYKSSNGGTTWNQITTPTVNYTYAWYCFKLSTAPSDTNFVMSLSSTNPRYSRNGGSSWLNMANSHADYHEVTWYDDNLFLVGNDGGVHRMNKSFMTASTPLNNGLNITQFYAGGYYPTGTTIIGGTQDNGTRFSNEGASSFGRIMHSDGAFCAVNQQDENIRYVSTQNMNIYRQENGTSIRISTYIRNLVGGDNGVWFINPFEVNMLDGNQIYVPTRRANYRSLDAGRTWTTFTTDLPGDSYSIGLSNDVSPVAYVGGTASRIYRIDSAMTAVAGDEIPLWDGSSVPDRGFLGGTIGCIEVDPNNSGTIYCGFTNIDPDSRIWRIRNANTADPIWDDLGAGLPEGLPVNWIEVDPQISDHIIIGTDFGIYTSMNAGASWNKEERFPNAAVDQIKLRHSDRKLFIYTHGRGIWTADLTDNPIASNEAIPTKNSVNVFPNPSSSFIQIEGNVDVVKIYNSQGIEVIQSTDSRISTQELSNGTYFIEIIQDGHTSIEKLLVSH
ncbi:MAG: T9SS type A sorting domain-containing protein [Bacteroidia bacterium]